MNKYQKIKETTKEETKKYTNNINKQTKNNHIFHVMCYTLPIMVNRQTKVERCLENCGR